MIIKAGARQLTHGNRRFEGIVFFFEVMGIDIFGCRNKTIPTAEKNDYSHEGLFPRLKKMTIPMIGYSHAGFGGLIPRKPFLSETIPTKGYSHAHFYLLFPRKKDYSHAKKTIPTAKRLFP